MMTKRATLHLVAGVALIAGTTAAPALADAQDAMMAKMGGHITMMASPLAKNAGLQAATGFADVDVQHGTVDITVTLADGTALPSGTVLEGWLSSAGRKGGPGMSSASERDQKYGPAFGMKSVAATSRDIPYALSTGLLRRQGDGRTYVGHFKIDNTLTPYGAVAVTLESDGNTGMYDPRPGTPFLMGMLKGDMMKGDMMKSDAMKSGMTERGMKKSAGR